MKKAFRDAYNRELALLYERSAEFAAEYPGIADRLGGLLRDNTDPAVAGLLEGTAFLAARVQLKLDEEFRTFTTELLEQIFPDALAPTPSVMLVQAQPPAEGRDTDEPREFAAGDYLDARFSDTDGRVACRFALAASLTLRPLAIGDITYLAGPGPLGALGQDPDPATKAGLQIAIARTTKGTLADLRPDSLIIHLTGDMAHAVPLYEQIHCDRLRASLRWLDQNGDPVFLRLAPDQIEQIGFGRDERLFSRDTRLFDGFAELREAFVFPRKYLGLRLTGLGPLMTRITAQECDLVLEFRRSDERLAARVGRGHARLNCAPAINLFEETASQIRLDPKRHEFVVTPDSSPLTHYEVQRITGVFAHYDSGAGKVPVRPLYALPDGQTAPRQALYYTARRKPRRLTPQERRFGLRHRYRGTETYVALYEPPAEDGGIRAQRLQIRTLCSNRHLPEYLPIAGGTDDFHLARDTTVALACVAGPTPPRESMLDIDRAAPHRAVQGDVYWRLISYLSLNHFGLDDRPGRDGAAALRELLSLFADLSDTITETQIQGIIELKTRPVVRSIRRADGYFPARGLEIAVTFDETAFEGSGMILLAAVLDRFFAEYASVNSFTRSVTISQQRGEVMRWPPRTGSGALL
ncbi:type VI secretion system baseplate subunit TssF (plasmid) [Paracoccus sp. TK19116]|uniref:Type VI secretion system baseplate subunit TssF n=1 Tax=Paracoccus albicereus TaxID=2922394 RepID=A0ABT1MLK7_9RHOB|nr:type VI secretion system baseplate subunit TssF [Paracoccus albicereus]MCQ0969173.1 type VI secretion system baseplate subunit TssF [Paracoccus albicereus]